MPSRYNTVEISRIVAALPPSFRNQRIGYPAATPTTVLQSSTLALNPEDRERLTTTAFAYGISPSRPPSPEEMIALMRPRGQGGIGLLQGVREWDDLVVESVWAFLGKEARATWEEEEMQGCKQRVWDWLSEGGWGSLGWVWGVKAALEGASREAGRRRCSSSMPGSFEFYEEHDEEGDGDGDGDSTTARRGDSPLARLCARLRSLGVRGLEEKDEQGVVATTERMIAELEGMAEESRRQIDTQGRETERGREQRRLRACRRDV